MSEVLDFLLVPDRAAARRVRRAVASRRARAGTVVGTWRKLLDEARKAYLVPEADPGWGVRFAEGVGSLKDAFWSDSYISDAQGTAEVLGNELERLLTAVGPAKPIVPPTTTRLSERGRRHLADLSRLHEAMRGELPPDLAAVKTLLTADRADAARLIRVYCREGSPDLSPWQNALLGKLAADCRARADADVDGILAAELAADPRGRAGSSLRHLQEHLFGTEAPRLALDASVTCLAVRDYLEEVEVAAGMAQNALARDSSLAPSDIGVLLPAVLRYEEAVREVFARAGLPVSGLSGPPPVRNVGGETVFHFLVTRRRPAPAMALAALYSSPLMPWDRQVGSRLATSIMNKDFHPEPPEGVSRSAERMAALVRERHETPQRLRDALVEFGSLLAGSGPMERHAREALSALSSLAAALGDAGKKEVGWEELAALVPQAPLPSEEPAEFTREGAALLREGEEPWRPVRLLLVLGFAEGRYPAGPRRSAVFDDRDLSVLKNDHGFALATAQQELARGRTLFARQLSCAADRAVFLSPLRDPAGEPIAPSGTAAFMARLFTKMETADDLVLTLERESHRARVAGLPLAATGAPAFPRALEIRDPCLGGDLLSAETDGRRHETPSRLEELLVSPLAWFLDRYELLPREWAPEELDPATKGILAHAVFERLFRPDAPLPGAAGIRSVASKLLDEAVLAHAPFLLSAEWYVERRNLLREIEGAAVRFREFLGAAKATVLGVETTLAGAFEGVPVRGRTDLLLGLPSGHIFVVDYKKSKSDRRRTCMERGFDVQTSLYRRMLAGGSVVGPGASALGRLLKEGAEIGVLYYMMDDQRALTDRREWLPGSLPAIESPGDEISVNAEALLGERFGSLRAGVLRLNAADDQERFRRVGVSTYALSASPLVMRFAHPPKTAEEER